jgi:hypothetical protein
MGGGKCATLEAGDGANMRLTRSVLQTAPPPKRSTASRTDSNGADVSISGAGGHWASELMDGSRTQSVRAVGVCVDWGQLGGCAVAGELLEGERKGSGFMSESRPLEQGAVGRARGEHEGYRAGSARRGSWCPGSRCGTPSW